MDNSLMILLIACAFAAIVLLVILIVLLMRQGGNRDEHKYLELMRKSMTESQASFAEAQKAMAEVQDARLAALDENFSRLRHENTAQIDNVRQMVDERLDALDAGFMRLRRDNTEQIENIRQTVDEKLQTTLEAKISQSFGLVNDRLEQVHRGLGEMQQVASSVGDLKKILSNVKTRGILGEIQLGSILEQIMAPEQYVANIATKPGSSERVEFAICLPGDEDVVYLPIDAKFPGDTYSALVDAYDEGDRDMITVCKKRLLATINAEAKMIHDKYVEPPYTTDFAVMFLPFEGLYAEVVRAGMIEMLQRKYKVTIAGPTTMSALLNSLQMGFNTLAIEKKSSEVWKLLSAVSTEFDKFGDALDNTQKRLNQASAELDNLVGVRTRQIQRKLKDVTALGEEESEKMLRM